MSTQIIIWGLVTRLKAKIKTFLCGFIMKILIDEVYGYIVFSLVGVSFIGYIGHIFMLMAKEEKKEKKVETNRKNKKTIKVRNFRNDRLLNSTLNTGHITYTSTSDDHIKIKVVFIGPSGVGRPA